MGIIGFPYFNFCNVFIYFVWTTQIKVKLSLFLQIVLVYNIIQCNLINLDADNLETKSSGYHITRSPNDTVYYIYKHIKICVYTNTIIDMYSIKLFNNSY